MAHRMMNKGRARLGLVLTGTLAMLACTKSASTPGMSDERGADAGIAGTTAPSGSRGSGGIPGGTSAGMSGGTTSVSGDASLPATNVGSDAPTDTTDAGAGGQADVPGNITRFDSPPEAAGSDAARDGSAAAVATRLGRIQTRLNTLADDVMTFWKTKGPDPVNGGFYGNLGRLGNKSVPTNKGLIQQSRHLWAFSNWYARREPTPAVKAIADNLYRFLIDHFYDAPTRQFQLTVSETGTVVDARKTLYAVGFAIYALSTYGRVFQVPAATTYALEAFRALDARHDAQNLGYDEHNDGGWLTLGAQKSTNTHIHLMEAFTALYEATPDPLVKTRLEELVTVVRTKILQPGAGYDAQEFLNDWSLFGAVSVSYGHDIETAWLLMDTARVLGRPDDPLIKAAALTMGLHAAQQGFDASMGGYFENGVPGGAVVSRDKIWWVESEALSGLWRLYELTGDAVHLDRLESTLTFIETRQRDVQNPGTEWFWGVTNTGQINAHGDHKGEEWKASYHNSRALTFTSSWIADWLRSAGMP